MGSSRQSHCYFTKTVAQTRIQGLSGDFLLVSVLTLKKQGIFTDHGGHVQVSARACDLSDLDSGLGNSDATDPLSNRSA